MKAWIGVAVLALLAGCGGGKSESGLTAEEDAKLNEAAAMLDEAPEGSAALQNDSAGEPSVADPANEQN